MVHPPPPHSLSGAIRVRGWLQRLSWMRMPMHPAVGSTATGEKGTAGGLLFYWIDFCNGIFTAWLCVNMHEMRQIGLQVGEHFGKWANSSTLLWFSDQPCENTLVNYWIISCEYYRAIHMLTSIYWVTLDRVVLPSGKCWKPFFFVRESERSKMEQDQKWKKTRSLHLILTCSVV